MKVESHINFYLTFNGLLISKFRDMWLYTVFFQHDLYSKSYTLKMAEIDIFSHISLSWCMKLFFSIYNLCLRLCTISMASQHTYFFAFICFSKMALWCSKHRELANKNTAFCFINLKPIFEIIYVPGSAHFYVSHLRHRY